MSMSKNRKTVRQGQECKEKVLSHVPSCFHSLIVRVPHLHM